MSEQERWQENNTRYLSTALAWLRLRLERLAQQWPDGQIMPVPPTTSTMTAAPTAAHPTQKRGFLGWPSSQPASAAQPASTSTTSAKKPDPVTDEQIKQQADAMAEMEKQGDELSPAALVALGRRLDLSRFERDTLLLCIAMELDTRIADLCARAQDNPNRPYPTFALALTLFDEPSWDILSPQRSLRYWRLIEIHQPGAQPLTTSALSADERIVNYVKGLNYLDDRLASLVAPLTMDADQIALPPSHQTVVQDILRTWHHAIKAGDSLPVIQLAGAGAPR